MATYIRFAYILLVATVIFHVGRAIPATPIDGQCGANAIFKSCGSACSPTCEHPIPADNCIHKCVAGCFCKDGFVKNSKGQCILPKECSDDMESEVSSKCSENEEFKKCGSACAPTCANPKPPAICIKKCAVGCFCKEGFLRDHQGKCVLQRECLPEEPPIQPDTPKCPENEVFHSCGTTCPPTCDNPSPVRLCTKECAIGCFCKEGHLRNKEGKCVPAANCANEKEAEHGSVNMMMAVSDTNSDHQCSSDREIYSLCGVQLDCMASCDLMMHHHSLVTGQLLPPKCLQRMCKPACVCRMPYFRHANGQCVESMDCNQQ